MKLKLKLKLELEQECGITKISLDNAVKLIALRGRPDLIVLHVERDGGKVTASWLSGGIRQHDFTGFSWGYRGEGPHGLHEFLEFVGAEIDFEKLAALPFNAQEVRVVATIMKRTSNQGWLVDVEGGDKWIA